MDVVFLYDELLLSDSQKHHAKWRTRLKRPHVIWLHLNDILGLNYKDRKQICGYQGLGKEGLRKNTWTFWGDKSIDRGDLLEKQETSYLPRKDTPTKTLMISVLVYEWTTKKQLKDVWWRS